MKYKIVPDGHYSNWYMLYVKPSPWSLFWRKAGWHHSVERAEARAADLSRCYTERTTR